MMRIARIFTKLLALGGLTASTLVVLAVTLS
jgi:hypothetical protein